jgi:hypothetical protein
MSCGWLTGNGVGTGAQVPERTGAEVRHSAGAVGETVLMRRVSDRAKWRARAQGEWVA